MNKLLRSLKNQSGITMVEILISVFILSIGVTGSLAYFTTAKKAVMLARDKTTATSHGEYILENMRAMETLQDIVDNDWNAFVTASNLNTLEDEEITIAFADTEADPLAVTITVNWETNTRDQAINLITELTK